MTDTAYLVVVYDEEHNKTVELWLRAPSMKELTAKIARCGWTDVVTIEEVS